MAPEGSSTGSVPLPLWSSLAPALPPVPAAPSSRAGHSSSRKPHSGLEEPASTCTRISQRQKPPSPFSPRIRAAALSQITLPLGKGWHSRPRRQQGRAQPSSSPALPAASSPCTGCSCSAELCTLSSSCKILARQGKGTVCFRARGSQRDLVSNPVCY